ncbi:hypothetical protein AGLY_016287, partial [Aphis glycines]
FINTCVFGDNINPQQLLRNSNDGNGLDLRILKYTLKNHILNSKKLLSPESIKYKIVTPENFNYNEFITTLTMKNKNKSVIYFWKPVSFVLSCFCQNEMLHSVDLFEVLYQFGLLAEETFKNFAILKFISLIAEVDLSFFLFGTLFDSGILVNTLGPVFFDCLNLRLLVLFLTETFSTILSLSDEPVSL